MPTYKNRGDCGCLAGVDLVLDVVDYFPVDVLEGTEWCNLADFEEVENVEGVCGVPGVAWVSGLVLGLSALMLCT